MTIWNWLRNAVTADDRTSDIGTAFADAMRYRWLTGGVAAILLLAYFAELAAPTFSADYFYTLQYSAKRINYAGGRIIAGLLDILTSNRHPPTLFLAFGVAALAAAGVIFALMLGAREWPALLLGACLVAIFPHFFEPLSYHAIRISLPLSVLLAITAVAGGRVVAGAALIFLSAGLYQAGVYCAVVATLILAAVRSAKGAAAREVLRTTLLPRALAIVLGLGGYVVLMALFKLTGAVNLRRMEEFISVPGDPTELISIASQIFARLSDILVTPHFLFPLAAKIVFIVAGLALIILMCRRSRFLALGLLGLAALSGFGAAWITNPPGIMLSDRQLIAFAFFHAGIVLSLWVLSRRSRPFVLAGGPLLVASFVLQANIWHEYQSLKNRADLDVAQTVAQSVRSDRAYSPGLPLVIIGTASPFDYLPYSAPAFAMAQEEPWLRSVYSAPWSAERVLLFFLDFQPPTPADVAAAKLDATGMPPWPAAGSVAIKNGRIILVLEQSNL